MVFRPLGLPFVVWIKRYPTLDGFWSNLLVTKMSILSEVVSVKELREVSHFHPVDIQTTPMSYLYSVQRKQLLTLQLVVSNTTRQLHGLQLTSVVSFFLQNKSFWNCRLTCSCSKLCITLFYQISHLQKNHIRQTHLMILVWKPYSGHKYKITSTRNPYNVYPTQKLQWNHTRDNCTNI